MIPLRFSCAAMLLGPWIYPAAARGAADHPVICTSAQPYQGPSCRAPVTLPSAAALADFPTAPVPAELAQKLSAALELAESKLKAPALTAAIASPGQGFWSSTVTLDPHAVPPKRFYWASAGKTFTAVLILQLVEEGKLSLTTPIAQWFPDYPNARCITIEHLLTHTSGIFSFNQDLKFARKPRSLPPADLIAIARRHGSAFCPGEYWSYCNTGYVMLGLIAEQLDGRAYAEAVDARIVQRIGLHQTRALPAIMGIADIAPPHPSSPADAMVEVAQGTPFSAGCIVATAEDMVRFWWGLLSGKLLAPATVEKMFTPLYPMFGERVGFYGQGVMVSDIPDQTVDVWLGHSGGTPGIKAEVIYSQNAHAFVAVALNNDGSAQSTVNLLLKTLRGDPILPPTAKGLKP